MIIFALIGPLETAQQAVITTLIYFLLVVVVVKVKMLPNINLFRHGAKFVFIWVIFLDFQSES